METKSFKVPNMTCNGCVSTVRGEIERQHCQGRDRANQGRRSR